MILSIIGSHGGSEAGDIIRRKQRDIEQFGFTLWLCISHKLEATHTINKEEPVYFLYPSGAGKNNTKGARPTKYSQIATQWFVDDCWKPIDQISEVSGRLQSNTKVIRLTSLELMYAHSIFTGNYSEKSGNPIKFCLGGSTISCLETPNKHPSKERRVMAFGKATGVHFIR